MNSRKSLKINQDENGQANVLSSPIQISGGDRIKVNDNSYDRTPELYEALSSISYNGKTMKNESDILMTNSILGDLGYTSRGNKS